MCPMLSSSSHIGLIRRRKKPYSGFRTDIWEAVGYGGPNRALKFILANCMTTLQPSNGGSVSILEAQASLQSHIDQ